MLLAGGSSLPEQEPPYLHQAPAWTSPDGRLRHALNKAMPSTAAQALQLYREMIRKGRRGDHGDDMWSKAQRRLEEEWKIWSNVASAVTHAMRRSAVEAGVV